MKSFLPLVFVILCSFTLKAQKVVVEGYIITLQGDSLRGQIVEKPTFTEVEFKQASDSESRLYKPDDIKLFCIENLKTFAQMEIPLDSSTTQKVFGEMLVWGEPMTLFKFGNSFYVRKDSKVELLNKIESKYQREEFETQDINVNKRYVGILNYLMLDCSKMKSKVNNVQLAEKSLIKIIEEYNDCINPDKVGANEVSRKTSSNSIAFRAGLMATDAKVLYPYKPGGLYFPGYGLNFKSVTTLYFGGSFNLKINQHFSFNPELNFFRRKSYADFEQSSTINLDISGIQIGIPIQYNWLMKNKATFSLYGGFGFQIIANNKSGIDNPPRKYQEYALIDVSDSELSLFGGAQMLFKVGKKASLGLECRYEYSFRHTLNINLFNMYSLSIGPKIKFDLQ